MKAFCSLSVFMFAFALSFVAQGACQSPNRELDQVVLNVTVNDKNGDWITGLENKNFKVFIDGSLVPLTLFRADDVPMTIGILVDTSGSVGDRIDQSLADALIKFIKRNRADNEYFLMTFSTSQRMLVDLTQDIKVLETGLADLVSVRTKGNTKFYDAVSAGLDRISRGMHKKKVLITISDGLDNASKIGLGDIKRTIGRSGVILYNLNVLRAFDNGYVPVQTGTGIIDDLAGLTGGKDYTTDTLPKFTESVLRISDELRNQYTIGFTPSKTGSKGAKETWHKLRIEVELPPGAAVKGKPRVFNRKGYYSYN